MEVLCKITREVLLWGSNEPTIVIILTTVGSIVAMLVAYAILVYAIPLAVGVAIKRIRRTNFVRRIDRFVYLLQKEYGRKKSTSSTRLEPGESRVIMTLTGNLNDPQ